jgi:hypothetical protein
MHRRIGSVLFLIGIKFEGKRVEVQSQQKIQNDGFIPKSIQSYL